MLDNPFTPMFGGKPHAFFGRKEVLNRFLRALEVRGSADRAFFFTGARGSGKTALLEQLSRCAGERGWRTVDVGAEHALRSLCVQLSSCDEQTETISPSVEVKVLGSGGALSGKSMAKTTRFEVADFDRLLQAACKKQKKGVFLSVDEIQKVPLEDVSCICEAFQMASRKGCDVALAVAGLPFSYDEVIHQDGCTFMRRCAHKTLNLLSPSEVSEAFAKVFSDIDFLSIDDDALERIVRASSGQPYMMQLLGYHLVEYLNGKSRKAAVTATLDDVETVVPVALGEYEKRSLKPLLDELSDGEKGYLRAMALVADENYVSPTGSVGESLGKTAQQVSPQRRSLIDKGVIVPVGHGRVRFNIPYLRGYVQKPAEEEANLERLEVWGV